MKLKSAQKTVHHAQFSVHHAQIFVQRRTFFCAKEGLKSGDQGLRIKDQGLRGKQKTGKRIEEIGEWRKSVRHKDRRIKSQRTEPLVPFMGLYTKEIDPT